MSGVWRFGSSGVLSLDENPLAQDSSPGPSLGHKELVHSESNDVMLSYEQLDAKLLELGWHRFARTPYSRMYHLSNNSADLLTLPLHFGHFRTTHMYDIVVKTRSAFQVRDATPSSNSPTSRGSRRHGNLV